MRRYVHLVNPVLVPPGHPLDGAQRLTFASMDAARAAASPLVVEQRAAFYAEDAAAVPPFLAPTPPLTQSVLDHGRYSTTLPCLPHETSRHGCSGGRIVVRAPDHSHLCPTQRNFPCPVYSSGALRYGATQAFVGALAAARR